MTRIRLVDEGVVYRNPNPGYEFHFASHSHLVELSPAELLCTFQRGQALYSVDSVMVQARSTDGGRSWRSEGLIHDASGDDRALFLPRPGLVPPAGRLPGDDSPALGPVRSATIPSSTNRPAAFSRPTRSSTDRPTGERAGRARRFSRFPKA